ncbi:MAG: hypothetical protein IJO58_05395, partial [Clostridia bacterium]|nr:hypothetical protein [Clostridia bacterium]
MSKRVLAFIASLVMIVSMFSCVMTVSAADGVAEVGGTVYETLQAAHDAANAGDTITLVGDVYDKLTVTKDITLDLNGYAITNPNGGDVLTLNGGNIIINDSVGTGSVSSIYTEVENDPLIIWSQNSNSKAIINGGTFFIGYGVDTYPNTAFGANLEIYGGTFIATTSQSSGLFSSDYSVAIYGGTFTDTTGKLADGYQYICLGSIKYTVISADHEHTYESTVIEPTCTEAGKTVYTCRCGDTYEEEIEALGHTEETTTVDATCTTDGSITVTCTVCGETISTEVIEATGHSYVDGTCENCGEADPDAPQDGYLETLAIPGFNVKFESDYSVYVPKTIVSQYATIKVIASKAMYEGDTFVGYSDVELTEGVAQG